MHNFLTALFTMSLGGSVLALLAVALRFVFKKLKAPACLCVLLWAAVAVRLLIPSLPQTPLSVVRQEKTRQVVSAVLQYTAGNASLSEILSVPQTTSVPAVPSATEPASQAQAPAEIASGPAHTLFEGTLPPGSTTQNAPEAPARAERSVDYYKLLFALWAAGTLGVLGWGIFGWLRLKRRVRESVQTEKGVFACDSIESPFLMGLITPKIYVPSGLSGAAKQNVLAHERAHVKRGDHLIKPFGFLLLAVYWFNPLFWLCYALLCRDIEYACDAKVLKAMAPEEVAAYSETLLSFHAPRRALPACPVSFGQIGVKQRIKAALGYKKPAFWAVLAGALALICLCVFFLTDRPADPIAPSPAEEDLPQCITAAFTPEAVALNENESLFVYDADDSRVLIGVLWHDPALEQDPGTLTRLYELTIDGKTVLSSTGLLSSADAAAAQIINARLCEGGGFYGLCWPSSGAQSAECSLVRFENGRARQTLYKTPFEAGSSAALCVLRGGNVAVVTVWPHHGLTCVIVSPAGQTLSGRKTELAWDGKIQQLCMFPLPQGGVCYSADLLYDPAPNSAAETDSALTGIVSAAGEFSSVGGVYGKCCGVCGEYLLFSKYEPNHAEGQVLSLYKNGVVEAQIERKPPENNVLTGFTQYGDGLLAQVYGEAGEVYLEAQNGALSVRPFSSESFAPYGGIASPGGVVFSNDGYGLLSRTVPGVTFGELIESDYPAYEVLDSAYDAFPISKARVQYAAIAREKTENAECTLFVLGGYGTLAQFSLAQGRGARYLKEYGLTLEQDRVKCTLEAEGENGEREIRDFTVLITVRFGGVLEIDSVEENVRALPFNR